MPVSSVSKLVVGITNDYGFLSRGICAKVIQIMAQLVGVLVGEVDRIAEIKVSQRLIRRMALNAQGATRNVQCRPNFVYSLLQNYAQLERFANRGRNPIDGDFASGLFLEQVGQLGR